MKNFSLKALGAIIFAAGLVVTGVAIPAHAATMTTAAITSAGTIGNSGTNGSTITITATTVSAAVNYNDAVYVNLPTGWTFTSTSALCGASTASITGINSPICSISNSGTPKIKFANTGGSGPAGIPAGTAFTVTFASGFLNVATARDFTVGTSGWNAPTASDDVAVLTLGGAAPTPTPSPSATTEDPILANTGFDAAPYLSTGAVLALAGVVLMLFARRRQTR